MQRPRGAFLPKHRRRSAAGGPSPSPSPGRLRTRQLNELSSAHSPAALSGRSPRAPGGSVRMRMALLLVPSAGQASTRFLVKPTLLWRARRNRNGVVSGNGGHVPGRADPRVALGPQLRRPPMSRPSTMTDTWGDFRIACGCCCSCS